ncbi:MAG: hypothetical protein P8M30_12285 [Planctomycetaceae bacterium]|nr:hypothetical protein [Planctomycetaceae bacterium]MDC0273157.1 hypothetical protein [Planctomycetaceae bacterium]MDG2390088.1 hypothetical protein [Planctomycetaceae bacterium]
MSVAQIRKSVSVDETEGANDPDKLADGTLSLRTSAIGLCVPPSMITVEGDSAIINDGKMACWTNVVLTAVPI